MYAGCSTRRVGLTALVLAAALTLLAPAAPAQPQQQPRMVFHEMFTAVWCQFCPPVREIQSILFTQNPTQYYPMQVHGGDEYATTWGNSRMSMYGVTGYPTTVQDGNLRRIGAFGQSQYITDFNGRKNVPTDVALTISGQQISGLTYQFTLTVGLIASGTAKTVRLNVAQTLDNYPFGEANARNTFIQAASAENIALTPGQVVTRTRTFTFSGDSAANLSQVRVVAWTQHTTVGYPSEVYQSAYTSYPFFPDCNGNLIPDSQELSNCAPGDPDCADCNGNGTLDVCDIDACDGSTWSCKDCDGNGVPDGCEYSAADCNGNNISDQCEITAGLSPDCNNNGVPDGCDLAAFTSPDCNHNAVPDECDLNACNGDPWCDDCNNNGLIDRCDLVADYASTSPKYQPLGFGHPKTHVFDNPADAFSTATFTFTALGDLSASNEFVTVHVNGTLMGDIYVNNYFDCADNQIATLTMSAAAFNAAKQAGGGDITVLMTPSINVNPAQPACPTTNYIRVKLSYDAVAGSSDLNGNQIPDECEVPQGCPGDLNCDGAVTFDDIDPFVQALQGQAGWPNPNCPWANGDCNGDNDVTFDDIDPFVGLIGTGCP